MRLRRYASWAAPHFYLVKSGGEGDPYERSVHVCRAILDPPGVHLDVQLEPRSNRGEHTEHISAGLNLSRWQAMRLIGQLVRLLLP